MKKQTSFPFLHFLPVTSLFILVILANSCSSHYLRKADKEYEHLYYARAIEDYGKALKKKEPGYAVVNLARAYYKVNDIKNAEHYYKKAVALPEASTDDYLNYAKILMQKEDYDVAKVWLNLVTERDKGNALAPMLLNSIRYRQELFRDTTLWAIRKVQISGFINTFSPSIFESGIVFAADKKVATDSKTSTWTGNSYLDLYYSEQEKSGRWTTPQPLPGDINGKFHEGSAVFTQDGRTAYFTRNNYEKKKLGKSELNHSNLKLYRAEKVADSWTNIRELPFNNDAYSVGHPALSPDETLLYFISDKPGGFGGTDIWVAKKVGENWESPVNLGQTINSPGNEMFPYMHSDGSH